MSGAILALLGGAAGGGSGALTLAWADIYGLYVGSNAPLTVSGITGAINLSATLTGGAALSYTLNGVAKAYTGAFAVSNTDTLGWSVTSDGSTQSGTVTVTSGGATVGTFTYVVRSPDTGHE